MLDYATAIPAAKRLVERRLWARQIYLPRPRFTSINFVGRVTATCVFAVLLASLSSYRRSRHRFLDSADKRLR
jgi:hypothetical protein